MDYAKCSRRNAGMHNDNNNNNGGDDDGVTHKITV